MSGSIANGLFVNALVNVVPVVVSVHDAASGGDVRLTSSCFRHVKTPPAWLTCFVWAASASASPLTPSHPP
jgi:hypothetical protein